MRKALSLLTVAAGLLTGSAYFFWISSSEASEVMLYKNPQCGCCESYAEYLRQNGFTVTVQPTHELGEMSRDAGIPDEFQGCHLSMIEDYVVSGHVPIDTINKLLTERPRIKGITLPGMPLGSPGMGGNKQGPFTVYEIGDETPKVYSEE
ncbi:DUF411 domain-containing protein [Roseibium salinum]|uniref:DUF411 domain-containing protein n=1 Tax=Roseibium salinum TaxID=1604349 RepID=A0ABT3QVU3_9HYPH|nr:DUF411 domain-containing protein [Roseibium sp. DSM 29163]MCX2720983.1 DUF411 domain-containing protein [Roseibium sp. DSM 29163]MDN3722441.1 DUF411 domain-containing protein [Roseibium salinum]